MKSLYSIITLAAMLLLTSCARVYYGSESASTRHEVIAIIPPKVAITPRKRADRSMLKDQERAEADAFQQEMYSWMLRRKMQNKMDVDIQDIHSTNARLAKAGYYIDELTTTEICEILNVDGIITSNFLLARPISQEVAFAMGILVDLWPTTNKADVTIGIHDKDSEAVVWHYNRQVNGSVGSSHALLVHDVMRHASRKMPY